MECEGTAILGDAERLPFPDRSFDLVSSNGVLHHTPNMPAALAEIHRVLRPGGRATVIVYHRNSIHFWVHQVLARGLARGLLFREGSMADVLSRGVEQTTVDARPLVRVYTRSQVQRSLSDAGFAGVTTVVRHFDPAASPETRFLTRFPRASRWLSERYGWYVIATGVA
jgi:ubiquinone/menaquinone biosynthesis C-methylase UbiE